MISLFGGGSNVNVNASGTLVPQKFTPTNGQTVFNLTSFTYTPGTNSLLVFINGDLQVPVIDYVETNSTSFTLTSSVLATDTVYVIGFPLSTITQLLGTVVGNLIVSGSISLGAPLAIAQGGTGQATAGAALTALGAAVAGPLGSSGITGAAASGANSDITSLSVISSINGGQLAGLRNRIINGDMRIDQRNAGAAVTPTTSSYTLDRFGLAVSAASKLTVQQVVDAPAGFKYSTKITVASQYAPGVSDGFTLYQPIEGQNLIDFQFGAATAKPIAVSFWVKGSVAGNYAVSLRNSAVNRSYIGIVAVTTSWAQQTVLLTADTSGTWLTDSGVGCYLAFDLGSGSNSNTTAGAWQAGSFLRTSGTTTFVNQTAGATLNITGVQFEFGSVATTFEQRPAGLELELCQRYTVTSPAGEIRSDGWAGGTGASIANAVYDFPVVMRVAPTITGLNWTLSQANTPSNIVLTTRRAIWGVVGNVTGGSAAAITSSAVTFSSEL